MSGTITNKLYRAVSIPVKMIEHFRPIRPQDLEQIRKNHKEILFTGFGNPSAVKLRLAICTAASNKEPGSGDVLVRMNSKGNIKKVVLADEMYMMADNISEKGSAELPSIVQHLKDRMDYFLKIMDEKDDFFIEYKFHKEFPVNINPINELRLKGLIEELLKNAIDGACVFRYFNPDYKISGPAIRITMDIAKEDGANLLDFKITNIGEIQYKRLREVVLSEYQDNISRESGIFALKSNFSQKTFGYFKGLRNYKLRTMMGKLYQMGNPVHEEWLSKEDLEKLPNEELIWIYGLTTKIGCKTPQIGGAGLGLKDLKIDFENPVDIKMFSNLIPMDEGFPSVTFSFKYKLK